MRQYNFGVQHIQYLVFYKEWTQLCAAAGGRGISTMASGSTDWGWTEAHTLSYGEADINKMESSVVQQLAVVTHYLQTNARIMGKTRTYHKALPCCLLAYVINSA